VKRRGGEGGRRGGRRGGEGGRRGGGEGGKWTGGEGKGIKLLHGKGVVENLFLLGGVGDGERPCPWLGWGS